MQPYELLLICAERSGPLPDARGHGHPTEVVDEASAVGKVGSLIAGQVSRRFLCELSDAGRVSAEPGRLEIGHRREPVQEVVEAVVVDASPRMRLSVDD